MKKRVTLSIILSILGFIIILLFSIKALYIDKFMDADGTLDMPSVGQIGDFIGGFTGTIFSIVGIILLFETLALQRQESKEGKDVFLKQQFDNTFFELLKLHQENLNSLKTYDIIGNELKGRDFFHHQKVYLQDIFVPTKNISMNRKKAVEAFQAVYANHAEDFSIYFRTLYQLYSLIEKSKIKGVDQASYSKILRAQLSESELFFIRYNAMTDIGHQSAHYINLFNILKHLSHFELLEFKDWWAKLNNFERNGLGAVIKEIKYVLKSFLIDKNIKEVEKSYMSGRYTIKLKSDNQSEFSIEIHLNRAKVFTGIHIVQGLDKFTYDEIENLFKCIVKEFIIYSNYNEFNNRRELNFNFDIADPNKIIVGVKNWMSLPIKIHYWYE